MTTEYKIKAYKNTLAKKTTLGGVNAAMTRAERVLGLDLAIELRNERAKEISFKKSNFGFKLG